MSWNPFDEAILKNDAGNCCVVSCNGMHLCGYCRIPATDLPKEWHGDYDADALQYLRIHGGITFCDVSGADVIFGFDCAHAGDEDRDDLRVPAVVLTLAETMRVLICRYSSKITEWRNGDTQTRCCILDEINTGITESVGFGAMLDMLGGYSKITGDQS